MDNLYHLMKKLEELKATDEYIGRVIAEVCLVNRENNNSLFESLTDSSYQRLYQNKEKERLRKGLAKLVEVLSNGSFNPDVPNGFIAEKLPELLRDRRCAGVHYVVDVIDLFYNEFSEPARCFELLGRTFRQSVFSVPASAYDRDKKDLSSLEYQAFILALQKKVRSI